MSNQCGHGHLRRVCEICQRDEEIERLKAERDALKAAAEKGTEYVLAQINQDLIAERDALKAAAEREKVAQWMIQRRYATGHGDTTEDLLKKLEWQVAERERKAILNILWDYAGRKDLSDSDESLLKHLVDLIRARGET